MDNLAKVYQKVYKGYPWGIDYEDEYINNHFKDLEKKGVKFIEIRNDNKIVGFIFYAFDNIDKLLLIFKDEYQEVINTPINSNLPEFDFNIYNHVNYIMKKLRKNKGEKILYIIDVGLLETERVIYNQKIIVKEVLNLINKSEIVMGQTLDEGFIFNNLIKRIKNFDPISTLPIKNSNNCHIVFSFHKNQFQNFDRIYSYLNK